MVLDQLNTVDAQLVYLKFVAESFDIINDVLIKKSGFYPCRDQELTNIIFIGL